MKLARVGLLLIFGASCSGQSVNVRKADDLAMILERGFRVAVLPFRVSAPREGELTGVLAGLGTLLALEGVNDEAPAFERAATIMRRGFAANLYGGPLHVHDIWLTDTQLGQMGLVEAAKDTSRAAEIANRLDVDGVIYGDVYAWNRSYYVLQSTQEVGLRVTLMGRDGRELFFSERLGAEGSGITGGPTGYISVATEPLAGLKGVTLGRLAREVARYAAADLSGTERVGELDASHAMGEAPSFSFFSFATSRSGPLRAGDRVSVLAVGTAGARAWFDLGRYRRGLPLLPTAAVSSPRGERQTYVGHYVVQEGEHAGALPVELTILRRMNGRTLMSRRRVAHGTVTIDAR